MTKGIDESPVFKQLWSTKIFIVSITILSGVIGLCYMYFQQQESRYVVTTELKIENYHKKAIADSVNLIIKNNALLSDTSLIIKHIISDTSGVSKEQTVIADRLKKLVLNNYSVQKAILEEKLSKTRNELRSKVYIVMESRKRDDFYTAYENEYLVQKLYEKIDSLEREVKTIANVKIKTDAANTAKELKFDIKSLLPRCMFFGFVISCVIVLGRNSLLELLKKRRD